MDRGSKVCCHLSTLYDVAMGDWRQGVPRTASISERIERYTIRDPATDCWLWTGMLDTAGYGRFYGDLNGKPVQMSAHRASYEFFRGPIPAGMQIDHLCRVRRCVNPAHFEVVTGGENTRRGINFQRTKTHCPQGHPYEPWNLRASKEGKRLCLTCNRDRARKRRREGVPSPDVPQERSARLQGGISAKPDGGGNAKSPPNVAV